MKTTIKYSHNSFWNNKMIKDTIDAGLNCIELDIVYSVIRNNIFVSHSFRPLKCLYYGELDYNLFRVKGYNQICSYQNDNRIIKYVIIESKSFWINQRKLAKIMKKNSHHSFRYVMSVQSKWPHQWTRGIWLKSFYKKYKEELNIIDKRTETNFTEQVDLFPRYSWWKRILNNQF